MKDYEIWSADSIPFLPDLMDAEGADLMAALDDPAAFDYAKGVLGEMLARQRGRAASPYDLAQDILVFTAMSHVAHQAADACRSSGRSADAQWLFWIGQELSRKAVAFFDRMNRAAASPQTLQ